MSFFLLFTFPMGLWLKNMNVRKQSLEASVELTKAGGVGASGELGLLESTGAAAMTQSQCLTPVPGLVFLPPFVPEHQVTLEMCVPPEGSR